MSSFGQQFKNARLRAGLSQGEVARYLGYSSAQFVSNWERDLSFPPMESVVKLAKVMKTDAHEMTNALVEAHVAKCKEDLKVKAEKVLRGVK